jgi:hypothetical protein
MPVMNARNHQTPQTTLRWWVVSLCVLAGCEKPAIQEQMVPKDPPAPTAPTVPTEQPRPTPSTPAPATPPLAPPVADATPSSAWPWIAPDGWTLVPGERPMRLATYQVQGPSGPVEVAISRFPGDVGGMLANVNRWRGQVGLPPATEADLAGMIEPFDNPGFNGSLLHIQGAEQHIVVASIFESGANQTWTVRVSGTPEIAAAVKVDLFAFARTFGAPK